MCNDIFGFSGRDAHFTDELPLTDYYFRIRLKKHVFPSDCSNRFLSIIFNF